MILEELLPKVFTSKNKKEEFLPSKIKDSLMIETGLPEDIANRIAFDFTRRICASNPEVLTAPEIREMVCSLLIENKYEEERRLYTRLGFPLMDFEEIVQRFLDIIFSENKPFREIEIVIEREYQMRTVYRHTLKERYGMIRMKRLNLRSYKNGEDNK